MQDCIPVFLCSHWSHATCQIFCISALVQRNPEFCFPISQKYFAWISCHSMDIFPNMNLSHPMSYCASCNSCILCSIIMSAFLGVLVFNSSSLNSRNRVSPGCAKIFSQCFQQGFPLFYCRWCFAHSNVCCCLTMMSASWTLKYGSYNCTKSCSRNCSTEKYELKRRYTDKQT
jgi:hypothetical protein